MVGEGKEDDTVWIVKSHFPSMIKPNPLTIHKCILVVRSPMDCVWSWFNMTATKTHT